MAANKTRLFSKRQRVKVYSQIRKRRLLSRLQQVALDRQKIQASGNKLPENIYFADRAMFEDSQLLRKRGINNLRERARHGFIVAIFNKKPAFIDSQRLSNGQYAVTISGLTNKVPGGKLYLAINGKSGIKRFDDNKKTNNRDLNCLNFLLDPSISEPFNTRLVPLTKNNKERDEKLINLYNYVRQFKGKVVGDYHIWGKKNSCLTTSADFLNHLKIDPKVLTKSGLAELGDFGGISSKEIHKYNNYIQKQYKQSKRNQRKAALQQKLGAFGRKATALQQRSVAKPRTLASKVKGKAVALRQRSVAKSRVLASKVKGKAIALRQRSVAKSRALASKVKSKFTALRQRGVAKSRRLASKVKNKFTALRQRRVAQSRGLARTVKGKAAALRQRNVAKSRRFASKVKNKFTALRQRSAAQSRRLARSVKGKAKALRQSSVAKSRALTSNVKSKFTALRQRGVAKSRRLVNNVKDKATALRQKSAAQSQALVNNVKSTITNTKQRVSNIVQGAKKSLSGITPTKKSLSGTPTVNKTHNTKKR